MTDKFGYKWNPYLEDLFEIIFFNSRSEHCAPNLLITFINMMLFKEDKADEKLVEICKGHETWMFNGQKELQMVLVNYKRLISINDVQRKI